MSEWFEVDNCAAGADDGLGWPLYRACSSANNVTAKITATSDTPSMTV